MIKFRIMRIIMNWDYRVKEYKQFQRNGLEYFVEGYIMNLF